MAKKETFAQRAKALVKKYNRADFDPIEKKELESALQGLQQEQEEYRAINNLNTQDEKACGGKMYQTGGGFLPTPRYVSSTLQLPDMVDEGSLTMDQNLLSPINLRSGTPRAPYQPSGTTAPTPISGTIPTTYTENLATTPTSVGVTSATEPATAGGEFSQYGTSILPSLISGATTGIGNIILAGQQEGSLPRVNLQRVSAPRVSYAPGRAAAKREAARATSRTKHGVSRAARTRSEYLSNVGAREAAISGRLGETLAKSQAEEALVNANLEAGMTRTNAEIAAKEQMFNLQQESKERANKEAYTAAALQAIPQTVQDISRIKSQDRLLSTLGDDYGWYMYRDPNSKWYQGKKPVVGFRGKKGVQLARGYNR